MSRVMQRKTVCILLLFPASVVAPRHAPSEQHPSATVPINFSYVLLAFAWIRGGECYGTLGIVWMHLTSPDYILKMGVLATSSMQWTT